jgi:metal-responsive CopG/Arc/MetJ family transcriptional regulator
MKRTTISLPDDLAAALEREAARRRIPVSQVAREAIEARLGRSTGERRRLPFASLGRSGQITTSLDVEDILSAAWSDDRDR